MLNRIAGILVTLAIICGLEIVWLVPWYVAVPLGLIGYLVVRHGGFFIRYFTAEASER